jgi:hypothetical protein
MSDKLKAGGFGVVECACNMASLRRRVVKLKREKKAHAAWTISYEGEVGWGRTAGKIVRWGAHAPCNFPVEGQTHRESATV